MKQQAAQVYFPSALYFQIKQLAEKRDKPMATLIRDVMIIELKKEQKGRKKITDLPSFTWGKETDVSSHIDEIVYDLS